MRSALDEAEEDESERMSFGESTFAGGIEDADEEDEVEDFR